MHCKDTRPPRGTFRRVIRYRATDEEFSGITRDTVRVDENFPYIHRSFLWNFLAFVVYRIIMMPFAAVYCHLKFGVRFVGREKLRAAGRGGCFLFANHTLMAGDAFLPNLVAFPKKNHVLVNADNISIKGLQNYIMMCGAIPIAATLKGLVNMNRTIDRRIAEGCCITVYPEAHIWPYYTKIRPFPQTAMAFPQRTGAPVFTATTTYAKRRFRKTPRVTVYIDGPFLPDASLPRRAACEALHRDVTEALCRRASLSTYEKVRYINEQAPDPAAERIHLMYAGNRAVFDGLLIGALSAVRVMQSPLTVYLLTMDLTEQNEAFLPITEEQRAELEQIYRTANPASEVQLIDCGALYRASMLHSPNAKTSYTPYTFLRLFADRIPQIPDRVLYLDTDTVIAEDLSELFAIDMKDAEFGAALDYYGRVFMGYHYCNAGVLLLNMAEIRKTQLFERAARLCAEKKLFLPDQTALNRLVRRRILLPMCCNEQKHFRPDTLIQHFSKTILWFPYFHTRNIKPWQTEQVRTVLTHRYDAILDAFLAYKSGNPQNEESEANRDANHEDTER